MGHTLCACVFSLVTPRSRERLPYRYIRYIGFVIHGKGQVVNQGGGGGGFSWDLFCCVWARDFFFRLVGWLVCVRGGINYEWLSPCVSLFFLPPPLPRF